MRVRKSRITLHVDISISSFEEEMNTKQLFGMQHDSAIDGGGRGGGKSHSCMLHLVSCKTAASAPTNTSIFQSLRGKFDELFRLPSLATLRRDFFQKFRNIPVFATSVTIVAAKFYAARGPLTSSGRQLVSGDFNLIILLKNLHLNLKKVLHYICASECNTYASYKVLTKGRMHAVVVATRVLTRCHRHYRRHLDRSTKALA